MNIKRYWLIKNDYQYPSSGLRDVVETFYTVEELNAYMENHPIDENEKIYTVEDVYWKLFD